MKTIQLSDELYEKLKTYVVDPFDDTPDVVLGRIVQIADKAKQRWSPLDDCQQSTPQQQPKDYKELLKEMEGSHGSEENLPELSVTPG